MRSERMGFRVIVMGLTAAAVACEPPDAPATAPFVIVDRIGEAEASFDASRFRSTRRDGNLVRQFTLGHDTRQAFIPPLPSTFTFDVRLPPEPVLRLSIGASTMGEPVLRSRVDFRVTVDGDVVFDASVPRSRPNQWLEHQVDLSPWEGAHVRLAFETRAHGGAPAASAHVLPLWGDPVLASGDAEPAAPKLILISVDCLRADHLGVYGYERDTTPHLDELARDGVVFETAVATSSFTHPTHMSMLTGLPPSIHGATRRSGLAREIPFLPELLETAGYRTDAIVSGAFLSQSFGFHRGFRTYLYEQDPGAAHLVDRALGVLRRGEGQRQFLFLHLFDPHLPYTPPAEFRTRFGPRPPDISKLMNKVERDVRPSSDEEIRHVINLYDGEIAYLDDELGRFFDELKSMGLYESSLIIVTADHGEAFYEHGYWEHTQTLYEEMVRIPLIVKWPGGEPAGAVPSQVSQADVFPTLLEQAEATAPGRWSVSLRRHLDPTTRPDPLRTAVLEVTWDPLPERNAYMKMAFRRNDTKYVATLTAPTLDELHRGEIVKEEFYDLSRDANETTNAIAELDRDTRRSYRRELRDYLEEGRRLRLERSGKKVVLDPVVRNRLEALGYLEP